jgi:hypothetical protein
LLNDQGAHRANLVQQCKVDKNVVAALNDKMLMMDNEWERMWKEIIEV